MLDSVSNEIKTVHGRHLKLFKDSDTIASRIKEMGNSLTDAHRENHPIVIGILNGAFIFTADLIREIKVPCKVDFWRLSSYGTQTTSKQSIQEIMSPILDLRDQHVILVEDIIDSGTTLTYVRQKLQGFAPKSVTVVSLVKVNGSPVEVDYVGFISNGEFIVGYGLDIAEGLRELPELYYLDSSASIACDLKEG